MFTCKGVFLLPYRPVSDRMQAVFIIMYSMTIGSGMELNIYNRELFCYISYMLERFLNVEYCRVNNIDMEPKILENSNIGR